MSQPGASTASPAWKKGILQIVVTPFGARYGRVMLIKTEQTSEAAPEFGSNRLQRTHPFLCVCLYGSLFIVHPKKYRSAIDL
jgi:hypothetical protein